MPACNTMCVTYGTHCTPSHPWKEGPPTLPDNQGSFFLPLRGLGLGGVVNVWPVKPFETVTLIKGCTNKMDLDLTS